MGSPHVLVAARTLVDPRDPGDLAAVAAIQDGLAVESASDRPVETPGYDIGSLDRTRSALLALAAEQGSYSVSCGRKEDVDPVRHLIGTASGRAASPTPRPPTE